MGARPCRRAVVGSVTIPVADSAWSPGQPLPAPKVYPLSGAKHKDATIRLRTILVAEPDASLPLRVLVGTWNAGNAPPAEDLSTWLRNDGDEHELVVVGSQECTYSPRAPHASCDADWHASLAATLGPHYTCVRGDSFGQMKLAVYARYDTLAGITAHESGTEATGLGHVHSNKGGMAAVLHVWDTSVVFMNSHLAAHQNKTKRRNEDYGEIVSGCAVGERGMDCMNQFHHLVWMGDLNYRLDLSDLFGEEAASAKTPPPALSDEIQRRVEARDLGPLLACDQLVRARARGDAFLGFTEGDIAHEPTFKVKRAPGFEYSKERSPAYCDRIMWRCLPGVEARQEALWVAPAVASSDHKPVAATLALGRRPPRAAWVPRRPSPDVHSGTPRNATAREHTHAAASRGVPTWTIRFTSLFGHGLMSADYNGLSDPYVAFMGASLPKMCVTQVVFATLDPHWSPEKLPVIRLAAPSAAELAHDYILVNVVDYDATSQDDPIGCGVIHMSEILAASAQDGECDFEVPLTYAGVAQGKLTGRLRIAPGPPMTLAELEAAKARTRRIAPKKRFSIKRMLAGKQEEVVSMAPHRPSHTTAAAPAGAAPPKTLQRQMTTTNEEDEEDD